MSTDDDRLDPPLGDDPRYLEFFRSGEAVLYRVRCPRCEAVTWPQFEENYARLVRVACDNCIQPLSGWVRTLDELRSALVNVQR